MSQIVESYINLGSPGGRSKGVSVRFAYEGFAVVSLHHVTG
jgi:hypothetical protein